MRAVFLQFVEQGLLADAQDLGRAGLVVLGVFERQLDQRALGLFDGLADRDAQLALIRGGRHRADGAGAPEKPGGRCASWMVPSPARITARSSTLRSSRTLPGQA